MSDTFTGADFATAAPASEAPAPSSESSVSTSATPEPAAAPSATDATVPAVVSAPVRPRGPIPFDEHDKTIKNTREKTRAEVEQEWAPHAWAKQVNPERAQALVRLEQRAQTDPVGVLRDMLQTSREQPELAGQIRSLAAQILGQRGQPQAPADQEPGPDIPTDTSNGEPVVYSKKAMAAWRDWNNKQVEANVLAKLAPDLAEVRTSRQTRQTAERATQADSFSKSEFAAAQKWPGFLEHRDKIAERFAKVPLTSDDPREVSLALRNAYLEVLQNDVYPSLNQTVRSAAVADIHRKAGAGTVNPSSATIAPPVDTGSESWGDAFRRELRRANG